MPRPTKELTDSHGREDVPWKSEYPARGCSVQRGLGQSSRIQDWWFPLGRDDAALASDVDWNVSKPD
jgi:hypothetical protein